MSIITYKLVPKTWTNISLGKSINFQVLESDTVYWKYSTTTPTQAPYVLENCFFANLKHVYQHNISNGELYVYTADPNGAFISTGIKEPLDVLKQDAITRPLIIKFNQIQASTTLSVAAVRDTYTITVANTTGFVSGRYIILFDVISKNYSFYTQIGAPAGNVITLDTPLSYAYPIGTNVDSCTTDLGVDGSVTPEIFGLRGHSVIPGVDLEVDITRIIITGLTATAVDLSKFGDLAALTRGLILRKRNGEYDNIFNVKTNAELANITLDFQVYQKTNPVQGQDGFLTRLTFNGDEKLGVVVRLPLGDDLEFIVQDNISGFTLLSAVAEGHQVI